MPNLKSIEQSFFVAGVSFRFWKETTSSPGTFAFAHCAKDFKEELCSKLCMAVEKFSPNRQWQIETLLHHDGWPDDVGWPVGQCKVLRSCDLLNISTKLLEKHQ